MRKLSEIIKEDDRKLAVILFSMKETARKNLEDPEMKKDSQLTDEIYTKAFLANVVPLENLSVKISLLCYLCRGITVHEENLNRVGRIQDHIELVQRFRFCNAERLEKLENALIEIIEEMGELTVIKSTK